jgi:glyoxylase-like metal-dependent hydrolase (beta-lactamase superfamily II)
VLVDTGMHEPGSQGHLDRALAQVNLKVETTRLLVCTHAHSDHYGQAATIVERAGCELWMHPDHEHMRAAATDPDAALSSASRSPARAGVPEAPAAGLPRGRKGRGTGVAAYVAPDRDLSRGCGPHRPRRLGRRRDAGPRAVARLPLPARAPAAALGATTCSGRVSLYYDYGWSRRPRRGVPASLDAVEALDARLCLPGHGRTFSDVQGHIEANRAAGARAPRPGRGRRRRRDATAFDAIPRSTARRSPA